MTAKKEQQESKLDQAHREIDQAIRAAMERNIDQKLNPDLATGIYTTLSQQARQILTNHIEE